MVHPTPNCLMSLEQEIKAYKERYKGYICAQRDNHVGVKYKSGHLQAKERGLRKN